MQKKIIKPWLVLASFGLLGAIGLNLTSCGSDDPDPKPATAGFTFVVNPDESGSVVFTNTSVNGKAYSWDFGDGTSLSTEKSPTHVYSASGPYTVELTALGDPGTTPSIREEDIDIVRGEIIGPNLLVGGSFETADEASWTKLQGNTTEPLPAFQFGSTTGLPTGATAGGLTFVNDANAAKNVIFYQAVTLVAGTYRFSGLIKIPERITPAVETAGNPDKGLNHYWFETYLSAIQPTSNDGFNQGNDLIAGFSGWIGFNTTTPQPALDGNFPVISLPWGSPNPRVKSDADGNIEIAAAGTYYFVFKTGYCCEGGYGTGIAIDNWKLQKID